MSDSNPFAAHESTAIVNRWTRAGATQDEARVLGDDSLVADRSEGDLREQIEALRAVRAAPVEAPAEAPQVAQDAPDVEDATIPAPDVSDAPGDDTGSDVSQVAHDTE